MDELKFTGFEPRQVLGIRLQEMLELVKELQIKVAKLELAAEPVKKTTKVAKTEE